MTTVLSWKTEKRKVKDLIPADYNPRQMTEKQAKELEKSLKKFGLVEIPAIDLDNTLLAGHMRMATMIQLGRGEEEIDVRVPNRKLTDAEAKEYNLRSNKNTGEWDMDKLFAMPEGLLEEVGWEKKEIQKIIDGHTTVTEDDYNPDEGLKHPVRVALGEIWQLGSHRLMCGDSTLKEDVERLMDGKKADMVFTDPPYGVDYDGGAKTKRDKLANDHAETDIYSAVLPVLFSYTKDSAPFYIWHAAGYADMATKIEENGLVIRSQIIWNKNMAQFGALSAQYKQKHEPCFYCFKKGHTPIWEGPTNEVTVWEQARESKNEFHPTQKPIELAARAIKNHNPETVLDLFGGSGSTLIACEQTKRKCYMMELDPKYCTVILDRWEKLTGGKAIKIS